MVWQALDDHKASPTFDEDVETHWNFLPFPQESQTERATRWVNGTPGEEVFTLSPRIQLNAQMGNAPSQTPSTSCSATCTPTSSGAV